MATLSPRQRLGRLFHRPDHCDYAISIGTPPSVRSSTLSHPSSPEQKSLRTMKARTSFTGALQSKDTARQSPVRATGTSFDEHDSPRRGRSTSRRQTEQARGIVTSNVPSSAVAPKDPIKTHRSRRVSIDTQYLGSPEKSGTRPYSEDIADRNIAKRKPRKLEIPQYHARSSIGDDRDDKQRLASDKMPANNAPLVDSPLEYMSTESNIIPASAAYEDTAPTHQALVGDINDLPAPLKIKKRSSLDARSTDNTQGDSTERPRRHTLAHKPVIPDLRHAEKVGRSPQHSKSLPLEPRPQDHQRPIIRRSQLEKPLPSQLETRAEVLRQQESRQKKARDKQFEIGDFDADLLLIPATPDANTRDHYSKVSNDVADADLLLPTPSLILPATHTTHFHTTWLPAVTHEIITKPVHTIRQEGVIREIHTHEHQPRVQPITEVQVLPARHFISLPSDEGTSQLIPLSPNQATPLSETTDTHMNHELNGLIDDTVHQFLHPSSANTLALTPDGNFTPLTPFAPSEVGADTVMKKGYTEITTPDGHMRTEISWSHPAMRTEAALHETGAIQTANAASKPTAWMKSLADGPPIIPPRRMPMPVPSIATTMNMGMAITKGEVVAGVA